MVLYDEKVLQQFAEKLYRRAFQMLWTYPLIGALLGAGGGWLLVQLRVVNGPGPIYVLAVLLAAVGYARATELAFTLRFQAQTALCQGKIEANTRLVKS